MADSTVENRKYKVLEQHLNNLTKERISLDEEKQKKYNRCLHEILAETLVPAMKDNGEIFSILYKRFLYAGSYYENLKVGEPNEFDLNIQLKLPASEVQIIDDKQPGFVEVKIKTFDEKESRRGFQKMPDWQSKLKKIWLDEDDFLDRNKVLNWMQSVVDKSIIQFDNEWCVVPKPPHNQINVRFWRASFYAQERSLMTGKHGMKKSLKLIKLLRDEQNWKGLASYYIKTVYLWETTLQEPQFWSQMGSSYLFIHMLKRIMYCFQKKEIPFFWDERHNLLVTRAPEELLNIQNRIGNILKKVDQSLETNPNKILTYFGWCDGQPSPSSPNSSVNEVSPTTTPAKVSSTMSSRSSVDEVSSGATVTLQQPDFTDSTDSSQPSSSTFSPGEAQTPNDTDDNIDWKIVESIISAGAVAGALFAAGAYLLIRNAQRQARRQQGNNNN